MNIVLTADTNYVKQLCVTMCSVLCNTKHKKDTTFHIFCLNFSDKDYDRVNIIAKRYECNVLFYDMKKYLYMFAIADTNTFVNKYINISCYFRLLLLKILPESVQNCFYIDCDIIVNTDLNEVLNKVDGYPFATVMESLAMHNANTILSHLKEIDEFYRFRNEPNTYSYFNAGFFWIDLVWARNERLWERAMKFFDKYPNLPYADQDILNYTVGQREDRNILLLGPEYNVFADRYIKLSGLSNSQYSDCQIRRAYINPKIIHYAGPRKPWNFEWCRFYNKWWKYFWKERMIKKG